METTANPAVAQPFDEVLASLRKWAVDSIVYIKRRNHLTAKEKAGAIKLFEQYEKYLQDLEKPVSSDHLLEQQSRFNDHARYFEIPAYRLPDHINPVHNPRKLIYFRVKGDIRINRVFEGDVLLCEPVKFIADLKPDFLLVLYVRTNHRTPREVRLGLFLRVEGNNLWCRYDKSDPHCPGSGFSLKYSLFRIVHLYRVITISRDVE